MLRISQPQTLFAAQTFYRLDGDVEKQKHLKQSYKVVAVYDYYGTELPQQSTQIINKLLQACQFKPADSLLLNVNEQGTISIGRLQNFYSPELILIFGEIRLSRNIGPIKKNMLYEINKVKIVKTETPEMLEKNNDEKKILWTLLSKILNVNK